MAREELKKDWSLTEEAFRTLLGWLDEGEDSQGGRYLEMRRRLVGYFDRRNCRSPDELADETLNRVARRLVEEGGSIDKPPAHFCYLTARFVLLERMRLDGDHAVRPLEEAAEKRRWAAHLANSPDAEQAERQTLLGCLDDCLESLSETERELILGYYSGERRAKINRRRQIAASLGISVNALAIRAARIRARLESCVNGCADRPRHHSTFPSQESD